MTAAILGSGALPNLYVEAPVESPEWWLRRLHCELEDRRGDIDLYDSYYRGDHPLPWLPAQARAEFRRVLKMSRSNVCGMIVDATAERIAAEGFRLPGKEEADKQLWDWWQANRMDGDSDLAILEALISGQSYTLVEPSKEDHPNIYIEHASQAIVAYKPGTNRRKKAAGLKVWVDEWTGKLEATLYLPDWIYKFEAEKPRELLADKIEWHRRVVGGESWPARNKLKDVPLSEIANNPRLMTGGVSELSDVIDIQNRINKTLADRLVTQDFGAFPQKWASGFPDDGDQPIDIGRDRMVTTDVAETRFGQFMPAPLDPYSEAKREDVKDMAMRTRTPAQYLLGEMTNVNGETLKAAESGLVSKVRQRSRAFAEGFEETMRLACVAAGRAVPDNIETIWKNPEFRTDGETTDAAIKRFQSGVADVRQAREDVGYSATQIANMERRLEADPATALPIALQLQMLQMEQLKQAQLQAAQQLKLDQNNASSSPAGKGNRGDRQSVGEGQRRRRRRGDTEIQLPRDGDGDGLVNEPPNP